MPAFPVVGIGASAGGLEALEAFFGAMSSDSGMAFILVAHLAPDHASLLPELLQRGTEMTVSQVQGPTKVEPNSVYVIPPNKGLRLIDGTLQLEDLPQPRGGNLPIDNFLRSLADDQGSNAICIILSGTGTDGCQGVKAVKAEFGMVMAQDEGSAKFDGMPRSAISTGLVDYVLPPEQMPAELIKYAQLASKERAISAPHVEGATPEVLHKLFHVLRQRTGHDFSLYKKNTIHRRINRRLNVLQISSVSDYLKYLRGSELEVDILFKELLIGVTRFFRDPEAFEVLEHELLPELIASKHDDATIRVWVPGCSSGEEAYSLAILLHECLEGGRGQQVQVFGTDIDPDAIDWARAGVYPESILGDVSPERLRRYFTKEDGGRYRVKKVIRELLVFAQQNVIKDPPFTKLDMLSCRNLLIYLSADLQKRLLPIFHYSLNPGGLLFLGSSETVGHNTGLFTARNKKWKVFSPAPSGAPLVPARFPLPPSPSPTEASHDMVPEASQGSEGQHALQLVESILALSDTPPCIVIDDAFNLVYIHGHVGRFLELAPGRASTKVLGMARPGLAAELAAVVRKVSMHKQEVVVTDLQVEHEGGRVHFDMTARPMLQAPPLKGLMMVLFRETKAPRKGSGPKPKQQGTPGGGRSVEELERELLSMRENLQTTIEELETSNEELKSANEELQSTNEELQSTNEELETSKEELQSLNEESVTVNAELQSRIDDLSSANDDMQNLLDSTHIATLFLDDELRVRRFTPPVTGIIPLSSQDVGRPIQHFASQLIDVDLAQIAKQVLDDLGVREAQVRTASELTYSMKVRPYRTVANVIDGVVVTLEDITNRIQAEAVLRGAEQRSLGLLERSPICTELVGLDHKLRHMSRVGVERLGIDDITAHYGQPYPLALYPEAYRARLEESLREVERTGAAVVQGPIRLELEGREVSLQATLAPVQGDDGQAECFLVASVELPDRAAEPDRGTEGSG